MDPVPNSNNLPSSEPSWVAHAVPATRCRRASCWRLGPCLGLDFWDFEPVQKVSEHVREVAAHTRTTTLRSRTVFFVAANADGRIQGQVKQLSSILLRNWISHFCNRGFLYIRPNGLGSVASAGALGWHGTSVLRLLADRFGCDFGARWSLVWECTRGFVCRVAAVLADFGLAVITNALFILPADRFGCDFGARSLLWDCTRAFVCRVAAVIADFGHAVIKNILFILNIECANVFCRRRSWHCSVEIRSAVFLSGGCARISAQGDCCVHMLRVVLWGSWPHGILCRWTCTVMVGWALSCSLALGNVLQVAECVRWASAR